MKIVMMVMLFSGLTFAKYEWPGYRAKEGEHCDYETRPGFDCAEGLFCHRTDPADYWGGTCRVSCKTDADCKPREVCNHETGVGACLKD